MEKKKLLQYGNPAEQGLTLLSSDGTQCCPCGTMPLSKANKEKKITDIASEEKKKKIGIKTNILNIF